MSHFAYTRAGGIWNIGTSLLAAEMASIDAKTFASLNGDAGGTWAPSAVITIGGQGLSVPANVTLGTGGTTGLTVNSSSVFNFVTNFLGTTRILADSRFGDDNTTTCTMNSSFVINSGFVSNANSSFAGSGVHLTFGTGTVLTLATGSSLVCSAGALFNASVTCGSTLAVTGAATFSSDVVIGGTGSIVERVVLGTAANGTYSVSTADVVFLSQALSTSGSYTYTLDHVGAVTGKKMRISLEEGCAISVQVNDITGGHIISGSTVIGNSAGNYTSMDLVFVNSQWRHAAHSSVF